MTEPRDYRFCPSSRLNLSNTPTSSAPDPVNILLVDDEPRNLEVLEGILHSPEHRLVRAGSAEAALLALLHDDFAVLVLDIQMPVMNGLELANLIKERAKSQHIPIIFLTALYEDERRMLESYSVGAVDYLTKPVNPAVLRSKVAVFVDLFRKTNALEKTNARLEQEVSQRQAAERSLREANDALEARVEARTAALKEAHAEAERAGRAKDDFLAALSHELRTPLNPVLLVASEAAGNPAYSEEVRAHFATIRKNVELEARLIDDLLDLTRITRGKLALTVMPCDVHAILKDAIETVQAEIDQKRIVFACELADGRNLVQADSVRLQQVFWNVLKNAVKFTAAGGLVTVTSRRDPVAGTIVLSFADSGIGLSADEISRIFDAFSQGTHSFGGLGLGLAISRSLVEFQQGTLRVESPGPGKGSTFIVELPVSFVPEKETKTGGSTPPMAQVTPPAEPAVAKTHRRILLVEDHEGTRKTLQAMLTLRKYEVASASSVAEARELAGRQRFDVIISDIGLPDGTGFELMAEMKRDYGVSGIALTGYGMEEDIEHGRSAGFAVHLTKPIVMQSLDAALEQLVH
jgi:signal transduction histidine kinase